MTTRIPYTPPAFEETAFNCPFCHAYADQGWGYPDRHISQVYYGNDKGFAICRCSHCGEFSVWVKQRMVSPATVTSPPANSDLPDDVKPDYEEAALISSKSPRGAAALLRLAIQKLCKYLGEDGKNINNDIAALVKKGLPVKVQQALDIVRVVGNNAVHPGQIDLNDDVDTANQLFTLVNLIADVMITQPKHVEELYQNIVPQSHKDAIEKRDDP